MDSTQDLLTRLDNGRAITAEELEALQRAIIAPLLLPRPAVRLAPGEGDIGYITTLGPALGLKTIGILARPAQAPGARFCILDGTGHHQWWSNAEWVTVSRPTQQSREILDRLTTDQRPAGLFDAAISQALALATSEEGARTLSIRVCEEVCSALSHRFPDIASRCLAGDDRADLVISREGVAKVLFAVEIQVDPFKICVFSTALKKSDVYDEDGLRSAICRILESPATGHKIRACLDAGSI